MAKNDILIAGLGNPGEKYRGTRHNIGFVVVDELVSSLACQGYEFQEKWQAEYLNCPHNGSKLHLIKPQTFMNRSGQSVGSFYRFFKLLPDQFLVIHDDLDMAPGRIKLVKGGGAGGHNGIKSIVQSLGIKEFYRLKIGIGRPGQGDVHPGFPVEKYVLSTFTQVEQDLLETRISQLQDGVIHFLSGAPEKALSSLNCLK